MAIFCFFALNAFNACSSESNSVCAKPLNLCENQCIDVRNDPLHCGSCSSPCGAGHLCSNGSCQPGCEKALTACGALCVNLANDIRNCGSCDHSCSTNRTCNTGDCVLNIPGASIQTTAIYQEYGTNDSFDILRSVRDPQGNFYVGGHFRNTLTIGDQTLTNKNVSSTGFMAKIDSSGTPLWVQGLVSSEGSRVISLAVDTQGNVFVVGQLKGTMKLSNTLMLTSSKDGSNGFLFNGFVTKFDSSGNSLWGFTFGSARSSTFDAMEDIAVDPQGNAIAVGKMSVLIGTDVQRTLVFAKFDAQTTQKTDRFAWQKTWTLSPSTWNVGLLRILLDTQGNAFISEYFGGQITTPEGKKLLPINSPSGVSFYIAKLSANTGEHQWSNVIPLFEGQGDNKMLLVSPTNKLIFGGKFYADFTVGKDASGQEVKLTSFKGTEDLFWAEWDATTGALNAAYSIGSAGSEWLRDIAIDAQGNQWIFGSFSRVFEVGNGIVLQPVAGDNTFVAKLDANNKVQWAERLNEASGAVGFSQMFLDTQGTPWFIGYLYDSGFFGSNLLSKKGKYYDLLFFSLRP